METYFDKESKPKGDAGNQRSPNVLRMKAIPGTTDDAFFDFCQQNDTWRIERTAQGDIEIMEPAGLGSSSMSGEGFRQTANWADEQDNGDAGDSSAGYTLPSSAVRSPDASWTASSRTDLLTADEWAKFAPLCPDFALEVTSPSDSLAATKAKMQEYLDNGLRLGVLIHPVTRQVFVYRPDTAPQEFDDPATVSCEPEMPGFILDIAKIFRKGKVPPKQGA